MKKRIIYLLLAVLAVSFTTASYAKAKKAAAKPAATTNPLLGTWGFSKGLADMEITFTADKAVFKLSADSGNHEPVEMKYKFSKSPLVLEYKALKGKAVKISMKYTVKDGKLTYRFLETKNKPVPGLSWEFSQDRVGGSADKKDADTIAEKRNAEPKQEEKTENIPVKKNKKSEMTSEMGGEQANMTSDKPADTGNPLLGTWTFRKEMYLGEITFNASDVVVKITNEMDEGKPFVMNMKYKFSKSPLTLEYKNPKGKSAKLIMNYKVHGGVLTYSIPNQKNKPVPGFPSAFSQNHFRGEGIDQTNDGDTHAEKK